MLLAALASVKRDETSSNSARQPTGGFRSVSCSRVETRVEFLERMRDTTGGVLVPRR